MDAPATNLIAGSSGCSGRLQVIVVFACCTCGETIMAALFGAHVVKRCRCSKTQASTTASRHTGHSALLLAPPACDRQGRTTFTKNLQRPRAPRSSGMGKGEGADQTRHWGGHLRASVRGEVFARIDLFGPFECMAWTNRSANHLLLRPEARSQ